MKRKIEGFSNAKPKIKKFLFSQNKKIEIELEDGRVVWVPLSKFPELKKLNSSQRKKYHILAGIGIDFDEINNVYHISDFLGRENTVGL